MTVTTVICIVAVCTYTWLKFVNDDAFSCLHYKNVSSKNFNAFELVQTNQVKEAAGCTLKHHLCVFYNNIANLCILAVTFTACIYAKLRAKKIHKQFKGFSAARNFRLDYTKLSAAAFYALFALRERVGRVHWTFANNLCVNAFASFLHSA